MQLDFELDDDTAQALICWEGKRFRQQLFRQHPGARLLYLLHASWHYLSLVIIAAIALFFLETLDAAIILIPLAVAAVAYWQSQRKFTLRVAKETQTRYRNSRFYFDDQGFSHHCDITYQSVPWQAVEAIQEEALYLAISLKNRFFPLVLPRTALNQQPELQQALMSAFSAAAGSPKEGENTEPRIDDEVDGGFTFPLTAEVHNQANTLGWQRGAAVIARDLPNLVNLVTYLPTVAFLFILLWLPPDITPADLPIVLWLGASYIVLISFASLCCNAYKKLTFQFLHKINPPLAPNLRLSVSEEALELRDERETHLAYACSAFSTVLRQPEWTGLELSHLGGIIPLPNVVLEHEPVRQWLLALEQKLTIVDAPPPVLSRKRRIGQWLLQWLRFILVIPNTALSLEPGLGKFLVLPVVYGALIFGKQIVEEGWPGEFFVGNIDLLLQPFAVLALAAALATMAAGWVKQRWARFFFLLSVPAAFLYPVLQYFCPFYGTTATILAYSAFVGWVLHAGIQQCQPPDDAKSRLRAALAFVLAFVTIIAFFPKDEPLLWYRTGEEMANPPDTAKITEEILFAQPRLLQEQLAQVEAGSRSGESPKLFFVGMAGFGWQDIFLREVRMVDSLFKQRFATTGRSILLANNAHSLDELPVANILTLRKTLEHVGKKMNQQQDLLFLFITSHGSKDHQLSMTLYPFNFEGISPPMLRTALDEAGIRNSVIVVSACFSGGFSNELQNIHTMVITAAAHDRTSFGCNDENQYSVFSDAFFNQALRQTPSFREAFALAYKQVTETEQSLGLTPPSEPQIMGGQALEPLLQKLATEARAN